MAIAMVALLAFGGTYAYFTATANAKSATNMHTGIVRLKSGQSVSKNDITVVYDDVVFGAISYDPTDAEKGTSVKSYVFVTLTSSITQNGVSTENATFGSIFGNDLAVIKAGDTNKNGVQDEGETHTDAWIKLTSTDIPALDANTVVYYQVYDPENPTAFQKEFLNELKVVAAPDWVEEVDSTASDEGMPKDMGVTFSITITGKSIQYKNTSTETEGTTAHAVAAYGELTA